MFLFATGGKVWCLPPINYQSHIKRAVRITGFCAATVLLSEAGISAAVEENPWQIIAAQNVFRLRSFSVPEEPVKETPRKVAPTIIITGMTDLGGHRQILAEILEPGKPVVRPLLNEGDRFGSVEVLQIDVDHNRVKVRIDGHNRELFLKAAYLSDLARRSSSATSP